MTSRFVLDELDLDLSSSSLLVALGLCVVVIVVVSATLRRVVVVDERVVANLWAGGRGRMAVCRRAVVEGALAFAHRGRCGGHCRFLHVERRHGVHGEGRKGRYKCVRGQRALGRGLGDDRKKKRLTEDWRMRLEEEKET